MSYQPGAPPAGYGAPYNPQQPTQAGATPGGYVPGMAPPPMMGGVAPPPMMGGGVAPPPMMGGGVAPPPMMGGGVAPPPMPGTQPQPVHPGAGVPPPMMAPGGLPAQMNRPAPAGMAVPPMPGAPTAVAPPRPVAMNAPPMPGSVAAPPMPGAPGTAGAPPMPTTMGAPPMPGAMPPTHHMPGLAHSPSAAAAPSLQSAQNQFATMSLGTQQPQASAATATPPRPGPPPSMAGVAAPPPMAQSPQGFAPGQMPAAGPHSPSVGAPSGLFPPSTAGAAPPPLPGQQPQYGYPQQQQPQQQQPQPPQQQQQQQQQPQQQQSPAGQYGYAAPGARFPPMPGQSMPPMPGQPMPPMPGQPMPPMPGQLMPPMPGQPFPHSPSHAHPQQHMPQQPMPQQQQQPQPSQPQQGARNASSVDLAQVPSPVGVLAVDQAAHEGRPYYTRSSAKAPPLSFTECSIIDDGNCSPHFIRSTMYQIPTTSDLQKSCKIPFGFVLQPFAETSITVPLVDHGARGPVRCGRCLAYINPHSRFVDNGSSYICALCGLKNEVTGDFYCNLDVMGQRLDQKDRPELSRGSVDYVAPADYFVRPAAPLHIVFVVDVSIQSQTSGALQAMCDAIRLSLDSLPEQVSLDGERKPSPVRVSLVAFDRFVYFFNLSSESESSIPQMMVCSDLENVFIPIHKGIYCEPATSQGRASLLSVLDFLPSHFSCIGSPHAGFAAAVDAAQKILVESGGRVVAQLCSLPTYGPGSLLSRGDERSVLNTDGEKAWFGPQGKSKFYDNMAKTFVKAGVSLDLFLTCPLPSADARTTSLSNSAQVLTSPSGAAFMDVATLGHVPLRTGGRTFHYPRWYAPRDTIQLTEEVARRVSQTQGYDTLSRIRTSTGVDIASYYCGLAEPSNSDLAVPLMDSDFALAIKMSYDSKLDDSPVIVQSATLYTTPFGQHRVRVHTLALRTTTSSQATFQHADMDALAAYTFKQAVYSCLSEGQAVAEAKTKLLKRAAALLAAYRSQCSYQTPASHLVMPETLSTIPPYLLGMCKSSALGTALDGEMSVDTRVAAMHSVLSSGVAALLLLLYPVMYDLTPLLQAPGSSPAGAAGASADESPGSPARGLPLTRLSSTCLSPSGLFLLDNGQRMFLWLGHSVPVGYLQQLLGVDRPELASSLSDTSADPLPVLDTPISRRVRQLVNMRRFQATGGSLSAPAGSGRWAPLQIIVQKSTREARFHDLLIEDASNAGRALPPLLVDLHQRICAANSK
ncbi:hypothetical protein H696_01752 [Fonticula alba]|uniref:Protein transporter SEC24 n=1 Tax=Fonticula alba TaxID=691883 RepID=A0A058ZD96_FONAL|nr:hypothetical protein H696_01752 [Fonticula alba]KCV72359.1 hypothetical protein H696_01752 [Fonticula alba]|eukprot:XP_009493937.1 hypothetical protein H696_01752 [Fonticula alba]